MRLLVRVMFWLDALVLAVLMLAPGTVAPWMWGLAALHLAAAGWIWSNCGLDYRAAYEAEVVAHQQTRDWIESELVQRKLELEAEVMAYCRQRLQSQDRRPSRESATLRSNFDLKKLN